MLRVKSSGVGSCDSYREWKVALVHVLAAESRGLEVHVSNLMLSASLGVPILKRPASLDGHRSLVLDQGQLSRSSCVSVFFV